jgi:hypothetical protein
VTRVNAARSWAATIAITVGDVLRAALGRLQLRVCRVNVVAIQCAGYPFELVAKLVGSTAPRRSSATR